MRQIDDQRGGLSGLFVPLLFAGRFAARYVIGHTATLDRNVKALAAHLGQDAVIQDAPEPTASPGSRENRHAL
jgi:hypothetical protein